MHIKRIITALIILLGSSLGIIASANNSFTYFFTQNKGQWPEDVRYRGYVNGVSASFLKEGVVFLCSRETYKVSEELHNIAEKEFAFWAMEFVNANKAVFIKAEGEQNSRCNFYLGDESAKWPKNVSHFTQIVYENIYDNIDLKYYGTGEKLKYDFVLHRGVSPKNITLRLRGIKKTFGKREWYAIHSPSLGDS